ncbi:MAG TPA: ABC transporter substrate-binding protein [Xanthobacteraceae bacterium]|jgi:putative ABC transport system substrate-binding protein
MMRRREFISLLGSAAAARSAIWPLAARAQQPAKVWRIGIVVEGMRSAAYDGFLQGMDELGYVAGRNYTIEWRFADGRYLRILDVVGDFAKLNIDVIFLGSPAMIYPVRQATHTIPIVMGYSTDPVGNGFVSNLSHPGGNITGLASSGEDTSARQLQLLAALVPGLSRVGLLQNPENSDASAILERTQAAAQTAGLALVPVSARVPQDIDEAFQVLAREHVGALKVSSDRFFLTQQQQLADLALKYRLPSIFAERTYVEAGGLMSLGESLKDFYRHAASFVDKIFKGARAGDLPIEQLALFDLVVNRKTAQQLGVALPPRTGVAAYEVID